jgi:succinate dehydrogenase flavin-adding protein (antitoxin of CptAB toxin-antitoxin module)
MKKYYTIFITEESDYHCERMVATYEAEENLNSKDVFDLFLEEQLEKTASWSATEGKIPNTNSSYVVEGITTSDSPVEFISFDELTYDPSNRLGGE